VTRFGFHASHEQLPPSALLEAVVLAEQAGFSEAMCSDHFAPWSHAQGHSGFAWSWLGAALARTRRMRFGVVNAPGQRYHPAIIAQAAATLAEMAPGRFWLAVGSGEASNEHITGEMWPRKEVRNARLLECAEIMRALWRGEEVTHDGLVQVDRARLWSLPDAPPLLVGAAVSPETARWVGGWADGLVTVNGSTDHLCRVVEAFRSGGGEGKPMRLQVHLSHADDLTEARSLAFEQWRANAIGPPVAWNLATVEEFDEVARLVRPDDVEQLVEISHDPSYFVDRLGELAALGFEVVYLHHVGNSLDHQRRFVATFAEHVLPALHEVSGEDVE
jgi:probable non-F420 flavinoid oxidoreductase